VPVKPLLAAGGLESIANSIVSLVEHAEDVIPARLRLLILQRYRQNPTAR